MSLLAVTLLFLSSPSSHPLTLSPTPSCTLSLNRPSLYNNNIGDDGARALGEALKTNTTLTYLQ